MAHVQLKTVLVQLDGTLQEMGSLAAASQQWVTVKFPVGVTKFTTRHKNMVIGFTFLRAFVAWETFLEQSFISYLLGSKPPIGPKPQRLLKPTTRQMAVRILVGPDKNYVDWHKWDLLKTRAMKCFKRGKPYTDALQGQKIMFEEMSILRNAIAHSSSHSQEKFKSLVRSKLSGSYPPKLSVGGFLGMTVPSSSPPESFLEYYMQCVNELAELIIPT